MFDWNVFCGGGWPSIPVWDLPSITPLTWEQLASQTSLVLCLNGHCKSTLWVPLLPSRLCQYFLRAFPDFIQLLLGTLACFFTLILPVVFGFGLWFLNSLLYTGRLCLLYFYQRGSKPDFFQQETGWKKWPKMTSQVQLGHKRWLKMRHPMTMCNTVGKSAFVHGETGYWHFWESVHHGMIMKRSWS